jgi:hypothetical protein
MSSATESVYSESVIQGYGEKFCEVEGHLDALLAIPLARPADGEKFCEIEGHLESETRQDDPDRARRWRELEEGISISLPLLKDLGFALQGLGTDIARGATLNIGQLYALRKICRMFSAIHDQVSERLCDIEQAGYRVDQASEFKARLREIDNVLGPIGRTLEDAVFPLPAPRMEQPSSDLPDMLAVPTDQRASVDLPSSGRSTRIKGQPGPVRLPDPPFLTEEHSVPFDLPRLGTWVRVKTRPGPMRLPDPIDD